MNRESLRAARKLALAYIIFPSSSGLDGATFEEAGQATLEQLQTKGTQDPELYSTWAVKSLMFDGFILVDEKGKLFPHQNEIPARHRVHANGVGDLMHQLNIVDED